MNASKPRTIQLSLSRAGLAVVLLVIAIPWVALAALLLSRAPGTTVDRHTVASAAEVGTAHTGPWGSLSFVPLVIAPPVEYIDRLDTTRVGNPWRFDDLNETQLAEFLTAAEISPSVVQRILAAAKPLEAPAIGMVVTPDLDIVRALSPASRAKVYNRLSYSEENNDQANAFRFCGKSPSEWFGGAGLSEQTIALVEPLVYRNGSFMFFADFAHIAPLLASDSERATLAKALARNSTFGIRVQVRKGEDTEALIRYWGRGGRENEIRPVLESLSHGYGEGSMGVTRLLPRFARDRLFVYSSPTMDPVFSRQDCHWAALNFFNKEADDQLADPVRQKQELETNYHPIFGNLMLGDLVLFFEGKENLIHTAVYIADGVLFTKNGTSCTEPGMFIRIEDMKDFYPTAEPLRVVYRRRNDL